jgi:UDP-N-acetylglucosamine acyltransferase
MTIDSTARIEDGAVIGAGASIGPYCVVGGNAEIGENCRLIAHCVCPGTSRNLQRRSLHSPFPARQHASMSRSTFASAGNFIAL